MQNRQKAIFVLFAAALVFASACKSPVSSSGGGTSETDNSMLTITAATSHPNSGVYLQNSAGDNHIALTVGGIDSYSGSSFTVSYQITDIFGTAVTDSLEFLVSDGPTQTKNIHIDTSKLGHFTFTAYILNGASVPQAAPYGGPSSISLPKLGTRPMNFITYAVLPDPSQRRQKAGFSSTDADKYIYFGMAMNDGNFDGINMATALGIDVAVTGQLQWNAAFNTGTATDVDKIDQWIKNPSTANMLQQTVYYLSELTPYMPSWARTDDGQAGAYGGQLSEYGEQEFIKYIEGMAEINIVSAPNRPHHYYQVLWEPVDWWTGWAPSGTPGDIALVRVYELAYEHIHKIYDEAAAGTLILPGSSTPLPANPDWSTKPVVLGPTYSDAANVTQCTAWHQRQFDQGLGKYIDGLSIHAYYDPGYNTAPTDTKNDLVYANTIKTLVDMTTENYDARDPMQNPTYFNKPFFWGTEQGMREALRNNGPKVQAQLLTRENLIMMGEGFDSNFGFCFADSDASRYGYFYNDTPMVSSNDLYLPAAVSPKMVVPAYAAASLLLKGYTTAGRLSLSGATATNMGYKFTDTESSSVIYAVWNYGKGVTDTVTIPVGANQVTIYDIMGNPQTVDCPGGNLTINTSEYAQYVKVGS